MTVNSKTKQNWNLIDRLSEGELKRLYPGSTPEAARAKLVLMELKAHPGNEVDLTPVDQLINEVEGHHSVKLSFVSVKDVLNKFLAFSQVEDSTKRFYRSFLSKSLPTLGLTPKPDEIVKFRDNLKCQPGGKHAYHRALRAFFNWLYSPASGFPQYNPEGNPVRFLKAPKVPKRKMPAQDKRTIEKLFTCVDNVRDAAIIAVLIDTGGRRAEISNIYESDVLWEQHSIRAIAKGNKEVLMPFSPISEKLLRTWLAEYHPKGGIIWNINQNGIVSMLRRLERKSGIKCNAHTFRRGFASMLRRAGVDTLDILKLGHWQSLSMVQRYTESVDYENSQSRYKAPMGELGDSTRRLPESAVVPRPRIELGTRRFSVYCSTD
jgi:integrase